MQAKEQNDRRDFIRMAVNAALRFGTPGEPLLQVGQTCDLSARGIRFRTESTVAEGAELELEVVSENGRVPPLRARVRVIRVEPADGGYVVAAAMEEVR